MIKIRIYKAFRRNTGIALSLPPEWTADHNINPGDEISIYGDENGHLIIKGRDLDQNKAQRSA